MKNAPMFKPVFKEGCIFCNIIRGAVPCFKVFEDDISLAFLDHRPLFPGHTLLIVKSHIETLFESARLAYGRCYFRMSAASPRLSCRECKRKAPSWPSIIV